LQRAGFWRAWGRIEGLQDSPPFMTTRPSHNIINGFLKLTNNNSAAIGENPGRKKYLRLHQNMSIKQCRELLRTSLLRRGFSVIDESGKPLPEVTPNSSKYRGGGGVCEKFINCSCFARYSGLNK
jgi:hypothetical protein